MTADPNTHLHQCQLGQAHTRGIPPAMTPAVEMAAAANWLQLHVSPQEAKGAGSSRNRLRRVSTSGPVAGDAWEAS
jgi:hypothetical protein